VDRWVEMEGRFVGWCREGRALLAEINERLAALVASELRVLADAGPAGRLAHLEERKVFGRRLRKLRPLAERCDAVIESFEEAIAEEQLASLGGAERPGGLKWRIREISDERLRKAVNLRFRADREARIGDYVRERRLAWGGPLPEGASYGPGLDERIVELPLAFDVGRFSEAGRVLDAGAALNVPFVRQLIGTPACQITHFTQSSDQEPLVPLGDRVSYVYGDLRELDFRDGAFDRILCISTLEHVGMDNSRYGGAVERSPASCLGAFRELARVLSPGGTMLVTVPYGAPADRGWYRVFGAEDLAALAASAPELGVARRYFYYRDGSWREGTDAVPPGQGDDGGPVTGIAALLFRRLGPDGGASGRPTPPRVPEPRGLS
jgi:SAM-dependent methyltransferase